MAKPCTSILAAFVLTLTLAANAESKLPAGPETVEVRNGSVTLHALLWRPQGRGRTREELERLGPYEKQADLLGPVFARHGYVFLYLFRRGVGLSADQGPNAVDLMNKESAAHGQEGRNALQMKLLENGDMT